jgi:hypothetical protein
MIENEYGTIYIPKPVNWSEKIDAADRLGEDGTVQLDSGFESIYKDATPHYINVLIDGEEYITYNFTVKKFNNENQKLLEQGKEPLLFNSILNKAKKQPYQMKDYQLRQYFENIDLATVNPAHYVITTNEMISRGLLVGERLKLTDIFEAEEVF